MLNNLFQSLKSYIRFAVLRSLLFFAFFISLNLLTLFMAAIMYIDWHWKLGVIMAACLSPWALAVLVLVILTLVYAAKFRKTKQTLCQCSGRGLGSIVFSIVLGYVMRKRR